MFLEVALLWAYREGNRTTNRQEQKNEANARPPLDAPAAPSTGAV